MEYANLHTILLGFVILAAIILFCWYNKKSSYQKGYWKGRASGWKACEDMVIDRIEKSPKYDDSTWTDLLQ